MGEGRWTRTFGLLAVTALLAGCASGCRQPSGNAELDRFLAGFQDLPAAERETALRARASGGGREGAMAHYALGNEFYAVAEDSADAAALLDSARVHFQLAAEADTTLVEAWVNLGSVMDDLADRAGAGQQARRQESLAKAEQAYKRALALRPTDEKARCNLGALHVKKRQYPEALAQFKQALADNPRSALAHYNLAIMFAESKMYREARREWEAAAKVDPKGDIGRRSRENVKIIEQMMATPVPESLGAKAPAGH